MSVELPKDKRLKVISQIKRFKNLKQCKIREFAAFIGTLGSCCSTLKYGRVYLRNFERKKVLALQENDDDFEAIMSLQEVSQTDLDWWKLNIPNAVNSITCFSPCIEIFTDASLTGWGAACEGKRTHGFWTEIERKKHINSLELMAALMGLKCFANQLKSRDVLLRVDNTTAIAYINKKGGVQYPQLNDLAKKIWIWCEERELWVFASYVSSKDNFEADFESRRLEPETEYSLSDKAFYDIAKEFGQPDIDLFATRSNTKCKFYVSWKQDPEASAVDAFTVNWNQYLFYAFPPFSLILKVLQKIKFENARGILVVPYWPAQAWFPIYLSLSESEPMFFKPNINLLRSINRELHPMWKTLILVANVLSKRLSK